MQSWEAMFDAGPLPEPLWLTDVDALHMHRGWLDVLLFAAQKLYKDHPRKEYIYSALNKNVNYYLPWIDYIPFDMQHRVKLLFDQVVWLRRNVL